MDSERFIKFRSLPTCPTFFLDLMAENLTLVSALADLKGPESLTWRNALPNPSCFELT